MKCPGLRIFVAIILCVCVRARAQVRVMDVISLKLEVGSAPVYQNGVLATIWQVLADFHSIQCRNNTSGETYCFHGSLIPLFALAARNRVLNTSCFIFAE